MANNLTDYLENKLLEHSVGKASFTMPTSAKLALFLVAPADDGTGGTEVSGGAYARQTVTWTNAVGGSISNASDIVFPTATANWGLVIAGAVYDQGTNMLWHGPLGNPRNIATSNVFTVPAGSLVLTLS